MEKALCPNWLWPLTNPFAINARQYVTMSNAKLKTKIRQLFNAHLESMGFLLERARIPERKLLGLRQGIEFQPGTGHLEGKYALNVYWSFMHSLDEGISMSAVKRIGHLTGGPDRWFSRELDSLDTDFQFVEELVLGTALPYLVQHDSISKIISSYEAGTLSQTDAFGGDIGWRHFNLGFCYSSLCKTDAAIHHFNEVVTKYSDAPSAWAQHRKLSAYDYISQLRDK